MAEQSPDPWRLIWRFATSDGVLVALLLAIAVAVTLTAWIPQQPASNAEYAPWFSKMQARFGGATTLMRALGLFSVIPSIGFNLLLALLFGCLLLRLIQGLGRLGAGRPAGEPEGAWEQAVGWDLGELLDTLRRQRYRILNASSLYQVDRHPWSVLLPLVAQAAGLLLLVSLLVTHQLGWQTEGLILQKGERRSLPGNDNWATLTEDGSGVRHSSGVVVFVEESGPGVEVSALNADGEPLELLVSPDADPSTRLSMPLTGDTYFAIPRAELIGRMTAQSMEPYARADIQIYSSPTGEVIAERVTDKGGDGIFDVADVTLTLVSAPYARVSATHNPGRLPAALCLIFLMIGIIGSLLWSERRFWLRENGSSIEVAGLFPPWIRARGEDL